MRLGLTVLVGLSSILFVWVLAIPIGVFSATHQYSRPGLFVYLSGISGAGDTQISSLGLY